MNARIALSSLVLAAAFSGAAFAESPGPQTFPFTSSLSRAEVLADLQQYRAAGVNPWATSYNPLRGFKSVVTRAEVVAGYIASRDEVRALNGEDGGSQTLAQRQLPVSAPAALASVAQ
jgi:hypothetical protein